MPATTSPKTSKILDGKAAAESQRKKIKAEASELKTAHRIGLGVLQVGLNPASTTYITQKKRAAEDCGFHFEHISIDASATLNEIKSALKGAVNRSDLHGLVLQLPLDSDKKFSASEINECLELIPPHKDADGLHPYNQGLIMGAANSPESMTAPIPATALGVFRLLEHYQIELLGRKVCVIGKSRLVGMPTAVLLAHAGSTVSLAHRQTRNLVKLVNDSDVVIAAAGHRHLVQAEWLRPEAVVIDVGIHVDPITKKLTGDLHPEAYKKIFAYSPVPGGVGPMTVASLMENTLRLAQRQS